jgi:hypothetical protein
MQVSMHEGARARDVSALDAAFAQVLQSHPDMPATHICMPPSAGMKAVAGVL